MICEVLTRAVFAGLALLAGATTRAGAEQAGRDLACAVGYYRLADGGGVDLGYAGTGELRWRRAD